MRIAIAQMPGAALDQWRQTWALIEHLLDRAAYARAEVLVLPECVWPVYDFGTPAAYFDARRAGLPGPEQFLDRLAQHARAQQMMICAGYVEERGRRLFNSACLLDASGQCRGVHRKCFLWDFDHDLFEPGDTIEPFETPIGPIGVLICADARLPEIPATLAAQGARLILQSTAWVNVGTPERLWNPQPDFLIPARACELGIPFASASKWGPEGRTRFVGSSLICNAHGQVVARCSPEETAVTAADVELTTPRPPDLSRQERAVLLSAEAPQLPRRDVPPLAILPLPARGDRSGAEIDDVAASLRPLLAFSHDPVSDDHARPALIPSRSRAVLGGPTAEPFELDGIRIGSVNATEAQSFAPVRALALRGVHMVVLFGGLPEMGLLRTRACENRVFLLAAAPDGWFVIDPRGEAAERQPWPKCRGEVAPMMMDVSPAADKCVAPHTDVLRARRVRTYRL